MKTQNLVKLKVVFFQLVIFSVIIISCNSEKVVPVTLTTKTIQGDLSEFFEIVEKPYSLIKAKGDNCFRVKVEVKRTEKPFTFSYDIADVASRGYCELKCDLLDENGNPTFIAENVYGSEGFDENNIINLSPNTTGWLEFSYCSSLDAIQKTKKLAFRASIEKSGIPTVINSTPSVSTDDSGTVTTTGSENWNSILNSYEKYITQYIALLKKANAGDMSAMTEYASMMEKATEFADKLENASDDLSPAQSARFLKLQTKLINAAAGL